MALYEHSGPRPYPAPYPHAASHQAAGADRMDAHEVIKILRRRRALITATVVLLTALSVALAYGLTPQYTASSSVVVDPSAARVVNAEAVIEEQAQDKSVIETEIKLLQSRSFARHVIEKAGLLEDPELNVALRGAHGFADQVPLVAQRLADRVPMIAQWLADRLPLVAQWLPESWLVATGVAQTSTAASEDQASASPAAPSDAVAVADPERVFEQTVDRFLGRLQVAQAGAAAVVSIGFTSSDAAKAARIANTVAELYVARRLEGKQSAAARSAEWLSERLAELRIELVESESVIAAYRDQHELLDDNGGTLDSVQLAALTTELIATRAELAEKRSKLGALRALRASSDDFESVSEVIASPVIADLRQQQTQLLRERAQLSQEYGPRHPRILQLEAEQQGIEDKVRIEIQNIVAAFERDLGFVETHVRMLQESIEESRTAVAGHKRAEVQLNELEREADANRSLYKAFLERYKKISEQQGVLQPGVQVISSAAPPTRPSFPRPDLIIVVGFTGSLVIATLLAFVAESLETGLRSSRQVEKALKVSSLGLVPRVTKAKGRLKLHQYLMHKPRSDYAEAVRAVQIGLQYTNVDRPPQIVLVTSSLPNEGKTSLALSLGTSAAASGHRTVVVDLDFRHPSVRRELDQPATAPGLVELITGEATLDQVTHVDPTLPDLHLITVRRNPANPLDLLASQKMASLMTQLRSRYKYIVLDAPPLLGISDTRVAVYLADAVLFVVRWGKTKAEVAQNGMAVLNECRAPVAGAVLTQVNMKRHAKRAYGDAVEYYGKYKQYYIN